MSEATTMSRPPIDKPESTTPARRDYEFSRPLTEDEAAMLAHAILWRPGSRLKRDSFEQVVGCCAHPDDVAEFLQEQRRAKRDGSTRLKANHLPREERGQR
jgi:hypothetical protein